MLIASLKAKFHTKYIINSDNSCWEWQEHADGNNGYGVFHYSGTREKAHRTAYKLFIGFIPEGVCVLHRCDNPMCVNPNHLFLGTHADNMKDKAIKGRVPRFTRETHPMTKLTIAMCKEIQDKYTGKYGEIVKLAKEYGVNRNTITQALKVSRNKPDWEVPK